MPSILEIARLLREFDGLDAISQNEFCRIADLQLNRLAFKLRCSPYQPHLNNLSGPNVNLDFWAATKDWLEQFPARYRLGALVALLSTTYITETELDALMNNAAEHLAQFLFERNKQPANWTWPMPPEECEKLLPFPTAAYEAYDRLVRRLRIPGTVSKTGTGTKSTLSDFLYQHFKELRLWADYGRACPYPDHAEQVLRGLATQLLDKHVLVVDDCSFSGTTLSSDLRRLLDLLRILYSAHRKVLRRKNRWPPTVSVLVAFATQEAVEGISKTLRDAGRLADVPVFCGAVEIRGRLSEDLPDRLDPLRRVLLPVRDAHEALRDAIDYYSQHFRAYAQETIIASRHPMAAQWKWGFRDGAYAVVTYLNAPNNSVPLLWYPHTSSAKTSPKPLFPRIESRESHLPIRAEYLDECIRVCLSAAEPPAGGADAETKHIYHFLAQLYEEEL
jgi:hypothetical protein